jgi:two-component system sensor histidine kinase TctE
VFQRFVRLDPGATGSGLGLAIVRDIARLHGARVELSEGEGGRGARFTVRFPPI